MALKSAKHRETPAPLDLDRLRVFPLKERKSLSRIEGLLVDPAGPAPACDPGLAERVQHCAEAVRQARNQGAAVILMYGAHLIKNGALRVVNALIEGGWISHLATNGAGVIHDWELAFQGKTEESVRANVAQGCFGTWDETSRHIHTALLAGAVIEEGYGRSVGRMIAEEGVTLPDRQALRDLLSHEPEHPLAPARADLLQAMVKHKLPEGRLELLHPWKATSILANAFLHGVPLTVHPGIGYDIISNHPIFNGAAIGRAAALDFRVFGGSVEQLDHGVILSVGSAIMAPQVFEKSLSCVNNLRRQSGREVVKNHRIYVVDLQDGGNWDWSHGEPPKTNPAYYLRFCKSFARMGGTMEYLQCDNVLFLHRLLKALV